MKGLTGRRLNQRIIAGVVAVLMTLSPFCQTAYAVSVHKEPPAPLELTVQAAVDLAMKNNDSIKAAELAKEDAALNKSIRQKEYAQSIVDGPKYSTFGQDASLYGMKIHNIQSDISKMAYGLTKEAVDVGVRQLYWNILLQDSAIETAQIQMNYAEKQYRNAQLKKTVGLLTETSVLQAKAAYESTKAALTSAEGNKQTAMDALKKQIGVKAGTEIILTETLPEFTPIDIQDVDYYVEKIVLNAPTLKIQDKAVEATKYGGEAQKISVLTNMMNVTINPATGQMEQPGIRFSQEDQERQTEIGTENARIDRVKAEKDLRDTVRSLYYDALALEANYESLQQAMRTAEEALKTKQQMFDLGMATELEVLEAEQVCATYEDQFKKLVIGHSIDSLKLEHPWCA